METVQLLRELSQASGVSGYEEPVRAVAYRAFEPYAHTLRTDTLGKLIALQKGTRVEGAEKHSIMLAAIWMRSG